MMYIVYVDTQTQKTREAEGEKREERWRGKRGEKMVSYCGQQVQQDEGNWLLLQSLGNELHEQPAHVQDALHDGCIPAEHRLVGQELGRGGEGEDWEEGEQKGRRRKG